MLRTLARNIAANWMGYALQLLVTFFLTPFIVHELGDVRYGAWALVMGITGYYGLLDLGFRAGLNQFMTRYLAEKDFENLNRTASTGLTILSVIGTVVVVVSGVISLLAPWVFDFPEAARFEVQVGIVIVGLMVGTQFPFFVFTAVLTAAERFDISNVVGVISLLIKAALTVLALEMGYGLIGVALAAFVSQVVGYFVRWIAIQRVLPGTDVVAGTVRATILSRVHGVRCLECGAIRIAQAHHEQPSDHHFVDHADSCDYSVRVGFLGGELFRQFHCANQSCVLPPGYRDGCERRPGGFAIDVFERFSIAVVLCNCDWINRGAVGRRVLSVVGGAAIR